MTIDRIGLLAAGLAALLVAGCDSTPDALPEPGPSAEPPPTAEFTPQELRRLARLSPRGVPPADPTNRVADDPRAQLLGKELFFDPRLSGTGTISCATCHDPDRDFIDGRALPETVALGTRNTPSLWNVAWGESFFWEGRSSTLWGQALVPIEHPGEMGGDRLAAVRSIASDDDLRAGFEALFGAWPDLARFPARATVGRSGDPTVATDPTPRFTAEWEALPDADRAVVDELAAQIGKVLAAFQRLIVSGETPFDRAAPKIARGEPTPDYPAAARRGLKLFLGPARCHLCHSGPVFSDQAFHRTAVAPREGLPEDRGRFGAPSFIERDPFGAAGRYSDAPEGDAAFRARASVITGEDFGAFRTPGLRNVARTAPYMHAGQLPTLESVVRFYSDRTGALPEDPAHPEPLNEPLGLTEAEIADLVAFLETLSDESAPFSPRIPPPERN